MAAIALRTSQQFSTSASEISNISYTMVGKCYGKSLYSEYIVVLTWHVASANIEHCIKVAKLARCHTELKELKMQHCKSKLVVSTTEWLCWLQTNWRDSGYEVCFGTHRRRKQFHFGGGRA